MAGGETRNKGFPDTCRINRIHGSHDVQKLKYLLLNILILMFQFPNTETAPAAGSDMQNFTRQDLLNIISSLSKSQSDLIQSPPASHILFIENKHTKKFIIESAHDAGSSLLAWPHLNVCGFIRVQPMLTINNALNAVKDYFEHKAGLYGDFALDQHLIDDFIRTFTNHGVLNVTKCKELIQYLADFYLQQVQVVRNQMCLQLKNWHPDSKKVDDTERWDALKQSWDNSLSQLTDYTVKQTCDFMRCHSKDFSDSLTPCELERFSKNLRRLNKYNTLLNNYESRRK